MRNLRVYGADDDLEIHKIDHSDLFDKADISNKVMMLKSVTDAERNDISTIAKDIEAIYEDHERYRRARYEERDSLNSALDDLHEMCMKNSRNDKVLFVLSAVSLIFGTASLVSSVCLYKEIKTLKKQ